MRSTESLQDIYFEWGPLVICVQCPSRYVVPLQEEFDELLVPYSSQPDIKFQIKQHLDFNDESDQKRADLAFIGRAWCSGSEFSYEGDMAAWHARRGEDLTDIQASTRVSWKRRIGRLIPENIQRILNARFLPINRLQVLDYIYGILLPFIEFKLVSEGASFLHASAVVDEKNGGCVLFSGWGGCGKTSLSAYLLLDHAERYSFIGDDLTLVTRDGMAFMNPMAVHVYPYNISQLPSLARRLKPLLRGRMDLLHWNTRARLRGGAGAVRRCKPRSLYGKTTNRANVVAAHFLERYSGEEVRILPMSNKAFADKCANVVLYEFRYLLDALCARGALTNEDGSILPTVEEFISGVRVVVSEAMSGVSVSRILVPRKYPADELGRFFVNKVR